MNAEPVDGPRRKCLLGYTDRLTVRPGEAIEFKVSAHRNWPYNAQLVRIINADRYSSVASCKEIEVESDLNGRHPGREQRIFPGSCVVVEGFSPPALLDELTVVINFAPTLPLRGRQHLISQWDETTQAGWSLCIDEMGRLAILARSNEQTIASLAITQALQAGTWYSAAMRLSTVTRSARLDCKVRRCARPQLYLQDAHAISTVTDVLPALATPLMMAAAFNGRAADGRVIPTGCFDGRLEAPAIYRSHLSDSDLAAVMGGERPLSLQSRLIADWDFSDGIGSPHIKDRSDNRFHGVIHNLPLRAVKGTRWDGSTMEWWHAPEQYSAIHFHSDDLYDCGWLTDLIYRVPDDLRSGIYALRLRPCDEEHSNRSVDTEYIPFFVAAPKGRPQSKAAFIVPTYTYLAYGNLGFESWRKASAQSVDDYYAKSMTGPGSREYSLLVDAHAEVGRSIYELHVDGSPVHFSTWRRPLLNMRPDALLWTFCADLLMIDWLEANSFDYDIITDDLLQQEGAALLESYRVVMSGNHPEYATTRQLDAIESFLAQGGRWMYLGGNGYYWRTAVSDAFPGAIEVRRGLSGTGTWRSDVAESGLMLTGETGGIWRDVGRPPQRLFGVGFIAQGAEASYYRVLPGARVSRGAFILEGVEGDVVGDFGLFGGAAGQEIDRSNPKHGTPAHAIVLARSENHGPRMIHVVEEMKANLPIPELYRADTFAELVFFETGEGGAVFSVGSMAWVGSLGHNDYRNPVSVITANVLKRFCDREPL